MGEQPVVRMRGLDVGFGRPPVLKQVTLDALAGERIAVLGRSGSGKTTLLRILAGLQRPLAGEVEIVGRPPRQLYGTGKLQYLHQRPTLWDHLTVAGNIELAVELTGTKADRQVEGLIDELGLTGSERKYPFELSEGMKARVALARVFVSKPAIVLADEPFASLDHERRERLNLKLSGLASSSRSAVIMVTHDVVEALRFSNVVWVVEPGAAKLIALPMPAGNEALDPNALPPQLLSLRNKMLSLMEGDDRG